MQLTQFLLFNAISVLAQELGGDDSAPDTANGIRDDAISITLSGFSDGTRTYLASAVTAVPESTIIVFRCAPGQDDCNEPSVPLTIFGTTRWGGELDLPEIMDRTTVIAQSCSAEPTTVSCLTQFNIVGDGTTLEVTSSSSTSSGSTLPAATFIVTAGLEQFGDSDSGDDDESGSTDTDEDESSTTLEASATSASNTSVPTTGGSITTSVAKPTGPSGSKNGTTPQTSTISTQSPSPSPNAAAPGAVLLNPVVEKGMMMSAAGAVGLIFAAAVML